jgi:acetylornithine/succinyldiaminopimelate/putrescine aminotransferase
MEQHLLARLRALQDRFAFVTQVRGKGLLAAMEFDSDLAGRVLTHANAAGVLLNAVRPNTVRFMPPLTISAEEIDEAASRLEEALTHIG